MLPSQHALYEWNIYIPAYGEVIQSLAFSPLGRHSNDACLRKGYDPRKLLEVQKRTGVKIQEAFMVRTHPQWLGTLELIHTGRIGELRVITVD